VSTRFERRVRRGGNYPLPLCACKELSSSFHSSPYLVHSSEPCEMTRGLDRGWGYDSAFSQVGYEQARTTDHSPPIRMAVV
jgi:hypothetical protein